MAELLLILHLVGVIVWVGGGLALNVIASRTPPEHRAVVMPQFEWYGSRVLNLGALLVILAGFGLVAEYDLSITEPFILVGLAIFVVSGAIGSAVIGRSAKELTELGSAPGPPDIPTMDRLYRKIVLFSRFDLVLMLAAIVDMVVKPGL
jgi:uncharacterized membrane protein